MLYDLDRENKKRKFIIYEKNYPSQLVTCSCKKDCYCDKQTNQGDYHEGNAKTFPVLLLTCATNQLLHQQEKIKSNYNQQIKRVFCQDISYRSLMISRNQSSPNRRNKMESNSIQIDLSHVLALAEKKTFGVSS